jgi:hypothetical protein
LAVTLPQAEAAIFIFHQKESTQLRFAACTQFEIVS